MVDKQNEVSSNSNNKLNGFTITAIVLAAVGFVLNPFAILSIIGIVFGGIGIAKSTNKKDKKWAIISLSLAIMETLFWFAIVYSALAAL
ncbi:hypothetical protein AAG897_00040 [Lacticaseibacillus rhamnosus]|uniref:hypothetical protein n=1 Tax=Lacticaseibacillus rhamnosus TaxID=47715 RepID=UPI00189F3B24|nr:hypothetical protein [Lacticaseibacillus rhamnosus]